MSVTNPESGTTSFEYNDDGSLFRKTDAKGQKLQFTYDSLGRVTVKQTYRSDGTEDLCGKATNYWDTRPSGVGSTGWENVSGRLMAVRWSATSCPGGQFTEGYDAAGLRLWKQSMTDSVVHVFYNGPDGKPLADFYLQGGSVQGGSPMVYFAGKRVDNNSVEDRLGTGVVENGQQMAYFPYGELRVGTSTEVQFATYKRDSVTNLDYAHQRYFSSQIARFTTSDPSGSASLEAPQSFNQYGYAGGDPVNRNDPSGLWGYCDASEGDCVILAVRESEGGGGGGGGGPWTGNWDVSICGGVWRDPIFGDGRRVLDEFCFATQHYYYPVRMDLGGGGGGGTSVPNGSLTDDFRGRTTNALKGLSDQCKSALGGVDDLIAGVGSLRFFDGRKTDGDGAYKLSEIAIGNGSSATVYDIVNNRPDSPILNALVIPGTPKSATNSAVLISGNFFKHNPALQAGILVEEAMHAVGGKTDPDLASIAKKYGYSSFQDFILHGCRDITSHGPGRRGIGY